MNAEFFEALRLLEKEKGIPMSYLVEKISNAIVIAVKKDYNMTDNVFVDIDPVEEAFRVYIKKLAVEEVEDRINEIYICLLYTSNEGAQGGRVSDPRGYLHRRDR